MLKIGMTGGIASGKSTAAQLFANYGVPIIDTDQIAKDLTRPNTTCFHKIVDKFGYQIITSNGELNRKQLREIIFDNKALKSFIELLLHPLIREEVTNRVNELQATYCVIVIPLLIEKQANYQLDRTLVIDILEKQQINRVMKRDNITKSQALAILQHQTDRETRLAAADDVIVNHNHSKELQDQVAKLHQFYLSLALAE